MTADLVLEIRKNTAAPKAWEAWYRQAYPRVYYVAFRFARGNAETARDLVQETFTRFLQYGAIHRVTSERHALSFLIKTCRNLAIDRTARAREISLEDIPEYELVAPVEEQVHTGADLEELLRVLPPEERQMLQWTRDGFSLAEIAKKLNISYTAAGVRLHRLRKRLQQNPPKP
jgi:RNA polymerase sigma factor (sigma-70 family)